VTDEECGRKSYGFLTISGFFELLGFAVPHPSFPFCPSTGQNGKSTFTGGRYAPAALKRTINPNLFPHLSVEREEKCGILKKRSEKNVGISACLSLPKGAV
jgi:hypothetical protein